MDSLLHRITVWISLLLMFYSPGHCASNEKLEKKAEEIGKLLRNQSEPAQSNVFRECPVDGTLCQFSACARGKKLYHCAFGFASGVTGGAFGQWYVVKSPVDYPENPQPGTLRYGVMMGGQGNGVWITFSKSMRITLKEMLWVRSSTTIDGRGVNVTINGRMLALGNVQNVILHNLQINSMEESDTVHVFGESKLVWIDHVTSFDGKLGLVSVVQGSTDVTISNCFLSNPNFNMLLGAADDDEQDRSMRVTVYRNWFKDSTQRMPHCRWGYSHVVNNLYDNWGYYAIGGRVHAMVRSEANVFMAGAKKEITPWYEGAEGKLDTTPCIESHKDLLLNGATFHEFLEYRPTSIPEYKSIPPPSLPPVNIVMLLQGCSGSLYASRLRMCLESLRSHSSFSSS